MIMQLQGLGLTPAYKHFQRMASRNPNMTILEFLVLQRGYRIFVKE
jgi:hypothetical protein